MTLTYESVTLALAQHLEDKGLVRWEPSGSYVGEDPLKPALRQGNLPASPETAVALQMYDWVTDRDDHNPDVYFQLRFRAAGRNPLAVNRLADAVFAELHWTDHHPREVWPGGVYVQMSRRVVLGGVVPDSSDRWERPDSYRITFNPGDES